MGVLQFVQYKVRPVSLFETPAQLEEYMAARRVLDQLEDHVEEERWKDRDEEVVREQRVRALLERAEVSAAWLTEHREWDQDTVAAFQVIPPIPPAGPCRLFLGPGFRLAARWNRLVETVKTRKKREFSGKKWARYGLRSVNQGS